MIADEEKLRTEENEALKYLHSSNIDPTSDLARPRVEDRNDKDDHYDDDEIVDGGSEEEDLEAFKRKAVTQQHQHDGIETPSGIVEQRKEAAVTSSLNGHNDESAGEQTTPTDVYRLSTQQQQQQPFSISQYEIFERAENGAESLANASFFEQPNDEMEESLHLSESELLRLAKRDQKKRAGEGHDVQWSEESTVVDSVNALALSQGAQMSLANNNARGVDEQGDDQWPRSLADALPTPRTPDSSDDNACHVSSIDADKAEVELAATPDEGICLDSYALIGISDKDHSADFTQAELIAQPDKIQLCDVFPDSASIDNNGNEMTVYQVSDIMPDFETETKLVDTKANDSHAFDANLSQPEANELLNKIGSYDNDQLDNHLLPHLSDTSVGEQLPDFKSADYKICGMEAAQQNESLNSIISLDLDKHDEDEMECIDRADDTLQQLGALDTFTNTFDEKPLINEDQLKRDANLHESSNSLDLKFDLPQISQDTRPVYQLVISGTYNGNLVLDSASVLHSAALDEKELNGLSEGFINIDKSKENDLSKPSNNFDDEPQIECDIVDQGDEIMVCRILTPDTDVVMEEFPENMSATNPIMMSEDNNESTDYHTDSPSEKSADEAINSTVGGEINEAVFVSESPLSAPISSDLTDITQSTHMSQETILLNCETLSDYDEMLVKMKEVDNGLLTAPSKSEANAVTLPDDVEQVSKPLQEHDQLESFEMNTSELKDKTQQSLTPETALNAPQDQLFDLNNFKEVEGFSERSIHDLQDSIKDPVLTQENFLDKNHSDRIEELVVNKEGHDKGEDLESYRDINSSRVTSENRFASTYDGKDLMDRGRSGSISDEKNDALETDHSIQEALAGLVIHKEPDHQSDKLIMSVPSTNEHISSTHIEESDIPEAKKSGLINELYENQECSQTNDAENGAIDSGICHEPLSSETEIQHNVQCSLEEQTINNLNDGDVDLKNYVDDAHENSAGKIQQSIEELCVNNYENRVDQEENLGQSLSDTLPKLEKDLVAQGANDFSIAVHDNFECTYASGAESSTLLTATEAIFPSLATDSELSVPSNSDHVVEIEADKRNSVTEEHKETIPFDHHDDSQVDEGDAREAIRQEINEFEQTNVSKDFASVKESAELMHETTREAEAKHIEHTVQLSERLVHDASVLSHGSPSEVESSSEINKHAEVLASESYVNQSAEFPSVVEESFDIGVKKEEVKVTKEPEKKPDLEVLPVEEAMSGKASKAVTEPKKISPSKPMTETQTKKSEVHRPVSGEKSTTRKTPTPLASSGRPTRDHQFSAPLGSKQASSSATVQTRLISSAKSSNVAASQNRRTQSHSPSRPDAVLEKPNLMQRYTAESRPKASELFAERKKEREEMMRKKKATMSEKQLVEKEQRKKDAETAFQNWLQRKELERRRTRSTGRPLQPTVQPRENVEHKKHRQEEAQAAFQSWLQRKTDDQKKYQPINNGHATKQQLSHKVNRREDHV